MTIRFSSSSGSRSRGSSSILFHFPGPTKIVRFWSISRMCADGLGKIGLMTSVVAASFGSFSSSKARPSGALAVMRGELVPDRQELRGLGLRVGGELVEVVDVDDHAQILA